jgi:class 3 adenylate cyclase
MGYWRNSPASWTQSGALPRCSGQWPYRNAETPEDKRITFRVGINIGDVIAEPDDIYGDGVNVAARLEALAEPGGICVSRVVRDQIRNKLPYPFEDKGEQSVKNIARSCTPKQSPICR